MTPGLFEHKSESVIAKAMAWLLLDEGNRAARQRSRQLIDGGVAAVNWLALYGQK